MPKIDVETLKFILQRNEPDIRKVTDIMQEIEMELKAEEEERANRPPAIKKQFAVMLADPDGSLAEKDITGWVVQIPEEDSPASAPERVIKAAYSFNATPKGRRMPVKTIGEACEVVGAKTLREQNIWVKTKTPVLAVPVKNQIPTDVGE
ncbi:MAG: hypothetical protein ACLFS4_02585 [Opitutales bacterium]